MHAQDPGPPHYLISVDLGVAPARTCISVCEMHGARPHVSLHVRAISRPAVGTKVAAIIDETCAVRQRLWDLLSRQYASWADPDELRTAYCTVLVDLTGSGLPALALFDHAGLRVVPLWLTTGIGFAHESQGYRVAKPDVISALSLRVESGRLKVAAELPEAQAILREFQTFARKTPLGRHDELAVWREQPEDDVVLSCGIAALVCAVRV
jgi:hypothetical protein